jgi:hypothetical protein
VAAGAAVDLEAVVAGEAASAVLAEVRLAAVAQAAAGRQSRSEKGV